MIKDPVKFVAYWNGDVDKPEFTTEVSVNPAYKLCIVTIEEIADTGQSKSNHDITVQTNKLAKLSKELKNLTKATKRLK